MDIEKKILLLFVTVLAVAFLAVMFWSLYIETKCQRYGYYGGGVTLVEGKHCIEQATVYIPYDEAFDR